MAKFCTECGSPLSENAKFCTNCGTAVGGVIVEEEPVTAEPVTEVAEAKPRPKPKSARAVADKPAKTKSAETKKPRKKKERKPVEYKPPHILWRILFVSIFAYLTYSGTMTFAIGFFGNWSTPKNVSTSFNKATVNGNLNDYDWWIYYDYFVEETGESYHDFTTWRGNRTQPNSGWNKYYVNYLPALPKLTTRLSKYKPVVRCHDDNDKIEGGAITLLFTLLTYACAYIVLALAEPTLPLFGFKRKS